MTNANRFQPAHLPAGEARQLLESFWRGEVDVPTLAQAAQAIERAKPAPALTKRRYVRVD
ncbi:MAG: hypothetical protein WD572_00230 [Gammaproteobacteria bacterium]